VSPANWRCCLADGLYGSNEAGVSARGAAHLAVAGAKHAARDRVRGEELPCPALLRPELRRRPVDAAVDLAYGAPGAPQALCPAVILFIAEDTVCWNVVEPRLPEAAADLVKTLADWAVNY
jgi:hypothetical protein